ncbi:hypothetical protein [Clostridium sp.]|uniref:hypothetical protein n=1 Tax=Clostridium sp. TaxID=1506 RepID=UPI003217FDFC
MREEELIELLLKDVEKVNQKYFKYKNKKVIEKYILIICEDIENKQSLYRSIYYGDFYYHEILINQNIINNKEIVLKILKYNLIRAFYKENSDDFIDWNGESYHMLLYILQLIEYDNNSNLCKNIAHIKSSYEFEKLLSYEGKKII